jgi:GR25 family glycosyltransferase involved in LPS biosynthesis
MKTFIISLSKIPSSAKSSQQVLKQLLQYGLDAELFEGTYGYDAKSLYDKDQRRIAKYGIKTETLSLLEFKKRFPKEPISPTAINITVRTELDPNSKVAKILRPGVIGCFYSHYRLWKKCIDLNEPILIFEDDVIFERNFIPVNWEEILLLCTGKDSHNHEFYSPKLYKPEGPPGVVDLPNTSMPGAVGYGITPQGAAKLVEAYKEEFLPADTAMNGFVVKLQCHTHLMGRAAVEEDGKESLTKTKLWNNKQ